MTYMTLKTIRYTITLLFGVIATCAFSGLLRTKKDMIKVGGIFIVLGIIQGIISVTIGFQSTLVLYPFHTHLVLICILVLKFHMKFVNALSCTLIAYMCCQIPAWVSSLFTINHGKLAYAEYPCYVFMVVLTLYFIMKYAAEPIYELIQSSTKMALIFIIVPLTYYLFDYITAVWTRLLYSGNYHVAQFMPLVICVAYLVFAVAYRNEQSKRIGADCERTILANELKVAENEIENMKAMDQITKMYRHDLRHHFSFLLNLAEQGEITQIVDYIKENIENINAITPRKYCDNEILNLILSNFAKMADEMGVDYDFSVDFPENQPLNNTEICVLFSNIMENAMNAMSKIPQEQRIFRIKIKEYNNNMIVTADNTYNGEAVIIENVPFTNQNNHGYGTKCIMSIAKRYNGFSDFKSSNKMFQVMVVIPLTIS